MQPAAAQRRLRPRLVLVATLEHRWPAKQDFSNGAARHFPVGVVDDAQRQRGAGRAPDGAMYPKRSGRTGLRHGIDDAKQRVPERRRCGRRSAG